MFETEMPAKREFSVVPSPETVVRGLFTTAKFLVLAAVFWLGGTYALSYAGLHSRWLWPWDRPGAAEAATVQPARAAALELPHRAAPSAPTPPVAAAEAAPQGPPQLTEEQFEQLRADVCHSLGKIAEFKDGQCTRRIPKKWSGEGIAERGAPVGEGIKKFFSMLPGATSPAEETGEPEEAPPAPPPPPRYAPREHPARRMADESGTWHPQLRLHGYLHEPGEPCPGGGHRDNAGFMCVFNDEEREELRRRRY